MDEPIGPSELTPLPVADPKAQLPAIVAPPSDKVSLKVRAATLIAVITPFFGLVAAIVSFWGWGFRWSDLALLLGMYVLTGLGITVGFHRLFTHHSFETNRAVQFVFAVLGSMAVEGPLMQWVALHRRHHQHSDDEEDPHSPHHQGRGYWGVLRGLWHSHVGWMFASTPADLQQYVRDLRQSKLLRAASALFPLVGSGWLADPNGTRLAACWYAQWGLDGIRLGWTGENPFRSPCYLEHQLSLPRMGLAALLQH